MCNLYLPPFVEDMPGKWKVVQYLDIIESFGAATFDNWENVIAHMAYLDYYLAEHGFRKQVRDAVTGLSG